MPLLLFQTWVLQAMDVCLLKFMGLIATLTKQGTIEQTATNNPELENLMDVLTANT